MGKGHCAGVPLSPPTSWLSHQSVGCCRKVHLCVDHIMHLLTKSIVNQEAAQMILNRYMGSSETNDSTQR